MHLKTSFQKPCSSLLFRINRQNVGRYAYAFDEAKKGKRTLSACMALGLTTGSLVVSGTVLAYSPYYDLYYAAKGGNLSGMKNLLESEGYGDLINAGLDRHESTVLHIASQYSSSPEMIRYLVSMGADIDRRRWGGEGAIHLAANNGKTDNVRTLLALGADVNLIDRNNGKTALHYAAQHDNVPMARLLLDYGADKEVCTYWNFFWSWMKPYDFASSKAMRNLLR